MNGITIFSKPLKGGIKRLWTRNFSCSGVEFARKNSKKMIEINKARQEKIEREKKEAEEFLKLKDTKFLNSLLKSKDLFNVQTRYNVNAGTPSSATSEANAQDVYVDHVTSEEANLIFNYAPGASIESMKKNRFSFVNSKVEATSKVMSEMVKRIISIKNQNAQALLDHNIELAIKHFGRNEGDTASPEVQAAVFTVRILHLADHLRVHKKDHSNRRKYTMFLHKRAKILRYLKKKSLERYFECLKELGLRQDMVEGQIPFPKRVE
ncbi:hypothetical protein BB558_006581 [Smittium angustum]|uniref:30S ribosomal protein S15 n=1 Tax=Smittium angustum TaxID=133377 RepID=A0A2U1IXE1_SMIAN|nr:hypothetical protein BB558_006581 [Smittium angustum]